MKLRTVEARTVMLDVQDFRRAVSAAANTTKILTSALELADPDGGGQIKLAADECIDGLAALAFAQIPRRGVK
jgi:hypothetical protein